MTRPSDSERRDRLRSLAELMRRQNDSHLPVTEELLDCFEWVITPPETDFLLRLGPDIHTRATASALWDGADFDAAFDAILKKGLVWMREGGDQETTYELAPILLGWFELQLCRGREDAAEREFARRMDRLFASWGRLNVPPLRPVLNRVARRQPAPRAVMPAGGRRSGGKDIGHPEAVNGEVAEDGPPRRQVIPVGRSVPAPENRIMPADMVRELVMEYGRKGEIALVHCFCRQWRKLVGGGCRFHFDAESCLSIGAFTEHVIRYGFGRRISLDEALSAVESARKAGAIHTVFYEKDDLSRPHMALCNCCWDCCGVLGSYNRGILPLKYRSHFQARIIQPDACLDCGRCDHHCPTGAITRPDGPPVLTDALCLGCGQCTYQCPAGVFELVPHERDVVLPLAPPERARIGP